MEKEDLILMNSHIIIMKKSEKNVYQCLEPLLGQIKKNMCAKGNLTLIKMVLNYVKAIIFFRNWSKVLLGVYIVGYHDTSPMM